MYLKAEITNRNVLCKTKQFFRIQIEKTLLHLFQPSRTTPALWFTYHIPYMHNFLKHRAEFFQRFPISKNEIWPKEKTHLTASAIFFICLLVPRNVNTSLQKDTTAWKLDPRYQPHHLCWLGPMSELDYKKSSNTYKLCSECSLLKT